MPATLVVGEPIDGGDLLQAFQLQQLTPETADNLHRYGDGQILAATIVRTPLSGALTGAIDAISGNAYSKALKATGYDSYYHLCLEFRTTKGTISLEKNETVLMSVGSTQKRNSQTYPIPSFPRITVRQVVQAVKQVQGPNLYKYSANSNNCQRFVADCLRGVGVRDPGAYDFVVQDAQAIFRGHSGLRKVANTVTDLAGIAQHARQLPRLVQRKILQQTGMTKYEDKARNLYDRTVGRATRGVRKFLGFGLGEFEGMSVKQLKEQCKTHGIRGYSKLKRAQLVEALAAKVGSPAPTSEARMQRNLQANKQLPKAVSFVYRSVVSDIARLRHDEAGMGLEEFFRHYMVLPGDLLREYHDDVSEMLRDESMYPRSASKKKKEELRQQVIAHFNADKP